MNHQEFFDTVVNMRKAQRDYSRSNGRDKNALQNAKCYEKIIDTEIKRVLMLIKEKQMPRLFH